jgi:hypothetical protein
MNWDPFRIEGQAPDSRPLQGLAVGTAIAVVALGLAAIRGAPYVSSSLNPFIAIFAVAAFATLFAVPFVANRRIVAADPERAEAWERAMLAWGAVALGTVAVGVLLMVGGGYSAADSLFDAAGLILTVEAVLVLVVLAAWLLLG